MQSPDRMQQILTGGLFIAPPKSSSSQSASTSRCKHCGCFLANLIFILPPFCATPSRIALLESVRPSVRLYGCLFFCVGVWQTLSVCDEKLPTHWVVDDEHGDDNDNYNDDDCGGDDDKAEGFCLNYEFQHNQQRHIHQHQHFPLKSPSPSSNVVLVNIHSKPTH